MPGDIDRASCDPMSDATAADNAGDCAGCWSFSCCLAELTAGDTALRGNGVGEDAEMAGVVGLEDEA